MRLRLVCFAFGLLGFVGCSSSDSVSFPAPLREKFSPTYHTHVVSVDQRKAFDAAKAALKGMDFRLVSGGPAQGKLSAVNGLSTSSDLRSSRQLSLEVKLTKVAEGTEIAALFSEVVEDDFSKRPGLGTSSPLRDTGIYDVYFQQIEAALAAAVAK